MLDVELRVYFTFVLDLFTEMGATGHAERLAKELYDEDVVESRRAELRAIEAAVVSNLPFDFRIHSGAGA